MWDHLSGPPAGSAFKRPPLIIIYISYLTSIMWDHLPGPPAGSASNYHIYYLFDILYVRPPFRTTSRCVFKRPPVSIIYISYLTSIMWYHLSGPPFRTTCRVRFIFFIFFYFYFLLFFKKYWEHKIRFSHLHIFFLLFIFLYPVPLLIVHHILYILHCIIYYLTSLLII